MRRSRAELHEAEKASCEAPKFEDMPMGQVTQVCVPDIGDFKDVPIIEIMVKPGDRVAAEAIANLLVF